MTAPVEIFLRADGLDDLVLSDGNGYCYVDLDLGFPTPRVDMEERNDVDGVDDMTTYWGARAVSLSMMLTPTDDAKITELLDALTAFLSPRRRPYLHYVLEEGIAERRIRLRGDALSAPLLAPFWTRARAANFQWVAPDGVQQSVVENSETVSASQEEEEGFTFDFSFDLVFPASAIVGGVIITVGGNVPVPPLLRLYGPCTNPRIENQTTDQRIVFGNDTNGDLVLAAGEYVELDVEARTVYLNGDSTQNRYGYVDLAESQWWMLEPGDNEIRYYPEIIADGAQADIMWRSAWL